MATNSVISYDIGNMTERDRKKLGSLGVRLKFSMHALAPGMRETIEEMFNRVAHVKYLLGNTALELVNDDLEHLEHS